MKNKERWAIDLKIAVQLLDDFHDINWEWMTQDVLALGNIEDFRRSLQLIGCVIDEIEYGRVV